MYNQIEKNYMWTSYLFYRIDSVSLRIPNKCAKWQYGPTLQFVTNNLFSIKQTLS